MTPPIPKKTLLLYISATTNVVSTVLIAEREEEGQAYPDQRPVYYMSEVLADAKTRYTQPQKLHYALLLYPSSQDHGPVFVPLGRDHTQPQRQRLHRQVVSRAWRV
jgi:hypothetical protein